MAPLPPYLVRIAASILTQALTRKLASSPLFFRIVDRMIHEIDHMPHRVQGRQVPTYQPPLGTREKEWQEDIGELHDLPNPYASPAQPQAGGDGKTDGSQQATTAAPRSFEEAQRIRARQSYAQSQRIAERERKRREEQTKNHQNDKVTQELRSLQDKLRELRNEGRQ